MPSSPPTEEAPISALPARARPAAQRGAVRWHLVCAFIVLSVLTVTQRFGDPDLWWHLKIGEIVWETRAIPTSDSFSYTAAGQPWVAHEWLGQLAIYTSYRLGGYVGVMLWLALVASLVVLGIYVLCAVHSGDHLASLVGTAAGWYFGTVGFTARPMLLGHLFLVIELLLLVLGRTRSRLWLWGMPPLFALWVNCHGSFFLGLIVLGVSIATALWPWRTGRLEIAAWTTRGRKTLLAAAGLSLAALILNPNGLRSLVFPLEVIVRQDIGLDLVQEWAPLTILDGRLVLLVAVLVGVFLAALAGQVALRLDELLLIGCGAYMALRHMRLTYAFGVFAALVVSRVLAAFLEPARDARRRPLLNMALVVASALIVAVAFPGKASLEAQVRRNNPHGAVEYIRRAGVRGPMLNDYTWGNYLIWALPAQKVFIDGRSEFYEWAGVLKQYARWLYLMEDPRLLLDKYKVSFCILRAGAPISNVLALLPEWKQVYGDELAVVFVRRETASAGQQGRGGQE